MTVAGVPDGAALSAGTDNGDGTWTLDPADLANLTATPAADSDDDFTLTVTATSTDGTDTATTTGTIAVSVDPDADDGTWTLDPADLANLTVTPAADDHRRRSGRRGPVGGTDGLHADLANLTAPAADSDADFTLTVRRPTGDTAPPPAPSQ